MTAPGDRDPSSEQPISAEWNGSSIHIYDVDAMLQDASSSETAIYDRSDFPYPIERVQVTAEVLRPEGEDALALESTIQLDRTQSWNSKWLNARFKQHLAPQDPDNRNFQKRPPFHIRNATFPNAFLVADEETGSRFVLWIQHHSGRVIITNEVSLTAGETEVAIHPPAMHSTSAENQLTSLMRATALVADFVNGFQVKNEYDKRISGIPLQRDYAVGQERRTVTRQTVAKQLGGKALQHTPNVDSPSESDNRAWDEKHGIEKFKPEEAITLSDIG